MQISLKWIHDLINLQTFSLNDFVEKLTLGGFEVEEIFEVDITNEKVTVLDISATANRSDSLSIQGLSLEIASLLDQLPKSSKYLTKTYSWKEQLKPIAKTNKTQIYCSGFIGIRIDNLTDFSSPKWLQQKLLASGINPTNNLKDFQDYILLETGYPFEIYNLEKIISKIESSNFQLHLTNSSTINSFLASNNKNYKLEKSTLLITANDLPLSIAGIIPSNTMSSLTNTPSSILIEGSVFNAVKIRHQSRMLGLRTDRSSRYEKSLKTTNLFDSLYRLISLLRIKNPTLICKLHTLKQPIKESIPTIQLHYKKINQVLGPIGKTKHNTYKYLSPDIITNLLKRLQFNVTYSNHVWKIKVSPLRSSDIVQEIDIIEEIGRIYGFNHFLTRLPTIKRIGSKDYAYQIRKKLTAYLTNLGLNELIQYSLVNNESYFNDEIILINPLGKEYSNLRSSLLPNLVRATEENLKKGNTSLEGFEYGHIFLSNSSRFIEEIEHVAGIFGRSDLKAKNSKMLKWFEAKGNIDRLFQTLNIQIHWKFYRPIKEKHILHPYCTASIFTKNNKKLGIFGQISPLLAKKLNISTATYLFEFNFELIKTESLKVPLISYQEYRLYPKISKDLSFIIEKKFSFNEIIESLYLNGSEFLIEVNLKDEYDGGSIPKNSISLCLQLVFQSNYKTLKNKKVEIIILNLKKVLTEKFGVIMRD